MDDELPSLLSGAAKEQGELLPRPAGFFFSDLESKGDFTGERLFQQRPDTYRAAVVLLGQKMGVIQIGKLLRVSPNTIIAVRDREGVSIDIVKEHLARTAHAGATLASEGIVVALNRISQRAEQLDVKDLKDLAVVYGILVQNGQLLAGQPTARVELTELQRPGHEDFNEYIRNLPQANATHLGGEKLALKEATIEPTTTAGEPASGPAGSPDQVPSDRAGTDGQSDV